MEQLELSWDDIQSRSYSIAIKIKKEFLKTHHSGPFSLYGIPRGGIFAVQAVSTALWKMRVVNELTTNPKIADIIIDDIVDTGTTKYSFEQRYEKPVQALVDYTGKDMSLKGTWIIFPWEKMIGKEAQGPAENITRLLQYIGEDVGRPGLKDTPERVLKSYDKLFGGYKQNPKDVVTMFDEKCDEMVVLKNVEFYSTCEHHMLPFFGKAHIAYIPKGKIIGVSKLARILEIFARRLQIQERICQQVTQSINDLIEPFGVACILEAQHFCMTSRGVEKQNSIMVTSSLTGAFRTKAAARNEFMKIIGHKI